MNSESFKMAIGKDPPQFHSETKPFARWKLEVQTWEEVTEHVKEKRSMVLALSLPEKDLSDIRTKVFEGLRLDKLKGETGFKKWIDFLDKEFGEDKIYDVFSAFEKFESVRKEQGQIMQQYISDFEQR